MRKFFAFAIGLGLVSQFAFANEFSIENAFDENEVIEAGEVSEAELEQMSQEGDEFQSQSGEVVAGGLLGGIIGTVSADHWDNEALRRGPGRPGHPGYGPGPRPGRPGHPGYGPGRPGPGHGRDRLVTCFAQNRRGQVFRSSAFNPRAAQLHAMNLCYSVSGFCRPLGCR